ncbi:MAG: hypothetical protein GXP55_07945 [Deltaproteobacteria bacterium]|nr:hypothetical protein [Deltaproteobacteria bacterium]
MRDELVALAKLAEMDLAAWEFDSELKELPERIDGMRDDAQVLENLLAGERQQLEAAEALLSERRSELELRKSALTKARAKGAQSRNFKQVDAAEREVEATRRAIKEREDEIASLELTIEGKTESLAERERQLGEAKEMLATEQAAAEVRLAELRKQRDKVLAGRDEVKDRISVRTMKRYERQRSIKGKGVVVIEDGTCCNCRMSLPAQLYIEVQKGEESIDCPQCRILLLYRGVVEV